MIITYPFYNVSSQEVNGWIQQITTRFNNLSSHPGERTLPLTTPGAEISLTFPQSTYILSAMVAFGLLSTFYCLLLFAATPPLSASEGWAATYGGGDGDCASSIQQTHDGGYIMAGTTKSFGAGGWDIWVLKLRVDGTVEWQKTYGGVKDDGAYSISQTSEGGYVVASGTESFGAGKTDAWVLKLRVDGTVEWQKTYGGVKDDRAYSISQTNEGGYVVAGGTESFGAGKMDAWVLKLRADGTVHWQKTYGGFESDIATDIQHTKDGGYIMAGKTASFGAGLDDFWVLKLRVDGTVEWQKSYGGRGSEQASCIRQTAKGGYAVTGRTGSYGAGPYDIWVLKLQADGSLHWAKTYGGICLDEAHFIGLTAEGGYIITGWTSWALPPFGELLQDIKVRFWVLKLRGDGSVEWQKTYGRGDFNTLSSTQQIRDGGYILAGTTRSLGEDKSPDLLVFKLRADGSINPSCEFVKETHLSGNDSYAIVKGTSASPLDSTAGPQNSSATIHDTDATVAIFCPSTIRP